MSVTFPYPRVTLERARQLVAWLKSIPPAAQDEAMRQRIGLGHSQVINIVKGHSRTPSARVLYNMGMAPAVIDLKNGEVYSVESGGRCDNTEFSALRDYLENNTSKPLGRVELPDVEEDND